MDGTSLDRPNLGPTPDGLQDGESTASTSERPGCTYEQVNVFIAILILFYVHLFTPRFVRTCTSSKRVSTATKPRNDASYPFAATHVQPIKRVFLPAWHVQVARLFKGKDECSGRSGLSFFLGGTRQPCPGDARGAPPPNLKAKQRKADQSRLKQSDNQS